MDKEVTIYIKEGSSFKQLKVPHQVFRDLVHDRLTEREINRIHRFADPCKAPDTFPPGSAVIDFEKKSALCIGPSAAGINLKYYEPTWNVTAEKVTLGNY